MKLALVIIAFMALAAYSTQAHYEVLPTGTFPDDDAGLQGPRYNNIPINPKDLRHHPLIRQKRFTCDLLSFGARGVSGFNHAACAAKCVAQRHLGGHCDGVECKCVSKKF